MNKSLFYHLAEAYERYRAERQAAAQEQNALPVAKHSRLRWLGWQLVPNIGTVVLVMILLLTQNAWARQLAAPAAPGPSATTVNYQGRLADHSGNPLSGTYGMRFALYDALTGGNLVWGPESHDAVPVSNGLFSVGLGSKTSGGIPTSVWNGDRYLEITVGGETLSPRELIRSVPIAGMALTVPDGAIGTAQIADRAVKSRNAQLTVGRVQASIPNGQLALTTGYQDVPGTMFTLTPETPQTYVVYVTADLLVQDATASARLFVDGVGQASSAIFAGSGNGERGTVSQTYLVNLAPGTHTLVLKATHHWGTRSAILELHTAITYFAVSQ